MLAQSPFDILAETYDADFTRSRIGRLQRERVWKFLRALLNTPGKSLKILEINCGTGEDALKLAAMGHNVVATDASAIMIEKAQQKKEISNAGGNQIEFIQSSFDELRQNFDGEKFDLVFSNFGGINCIDKAGITKLSSDLFSITGPGGYLFLTVMSRFCLWEILYYTSKGKLNTAFRRMRKAVQFNVNEYSMPVFYYSPRDLEKLFQSKFKLVETHPAGLFIPPSYLEKQFSKRPQWLNRLNHWEDRLGRYSMLSPLADHYCIILKQDKQ
ncbi:MAG TPA: methyltransferase domain-containing protein [Parafilimonas sp.]|nr:methyltransferase domain-containing protein [Parafilimonas sp.]